MTSETERKTTPAEPAVGQVWRPTKKVNGASPRRITAIGRKGVVWFSPQPPTRPLAGSTPVPRRRWDEWVEQKAAVLEVSANGQ